LHTGHEIARLLLGIGVVQAHHRREVSDGLETRSTVRRQTPLAGRIRGEEVGKLLLEVEQFVVEAVVGLVGNGGFGLDV